MKRDVPDLRALRKYALNAGKAWDVARADAVRTLGPSDRLVECMACDNVFIARAQPGRYRCPCGSDDMNVSVPPVCAGARQ